MGALEEARFGEEMMATLDLADSASSASGSGSESEPESGGGIEDAVRVLLQGLGEDHEREGIKKTPLRVAKAFRDGTTGKTLMFVVKLIAFWGSTIRVSVKISAFDVLVIYIFSNGDFGDVSVGFLFSSVFCLFSVYIICP